MSNEHEEAARATKAFRLTTLLQRHGVTAAEARGFEDQQWAIVAKHTTPPVHPPSPATVALVLTWLAEAEEATP